jgi:hypothetical protein
MVQTRSQSFESTSSNDSKEKLLDIERGRSKSRETKVKRGRTVSPKVVICGTKRKQTIKLTDSKNVCISAKSCAIFLVVVVLSLSVPVLLHLKENTANDWCIECQCKTKTWWFNATCETLCDKKSKATALITQLKSFRIHFEWSIILLESIIHIFFHIILEWLWKMYEKISKYGNVEISDDLVDFLSKAETREYKRFVTENLGVRNLEQLFVVFAHGKFVGWNKNIADKMSDYVTYAFLNSRHLIHLQEMLREHVNLYILCLASSGPESDFAQEVFAVEEGIDDFDVKTLCRFLRNLRAKSKKIT